MIPAAFVGFFVGLAFTSIDVFLGIIIGTLTSYVFYKMSFIEIEEDDDYEPKAD